MGNNKILSRISYLSLSVIYILVFFLLLFLPLGRAHAIATSNFSFFPGDPASANDQRTIASIFDSDGNDYNEAGWSLFQIYAKDFLGLGPQGLLFDSQTSIRYTSSAGFGQDGNRAQSPMFSFVYWCSASDGKITQSRPTDGTFYEIHYAVIIDNNNGSGGAKVSDPVQFMNQANFSGYGGIYLVKKTDGTTSDQITRTMLVDNKTFGPYASNEIKNPVNDNAGNRINAGAGNFGISDAKCQPDPKIIGEFTNMQNYNKLPPATKESFAGAVEAATKAAAAAASGSEDGDNCVTTDSGPLGWILCPIIDLASTFSGFVFKAFIIPFLEDVPVTTDPRDGSYIAWQQFRLIGNIVLVGSMLAVVYAQVKGN